MRTLLVGLFLFVLSALACPGPHAEGASNEPLMRLLIKKGILTQEEVEGLKNEAETAAQSQAPSVAPSVRAPAPPVSEATVQEIVDQLRDEVRAEPQRKDEESLGVTVTVEGEARWRARGNVGDRGSGSTSDLFLRNAEVDFDAKPLDYLTARLVIKSEWLGAGTTDQGQPADATPFIDEGTITLKAEDGFPFSFVFGQRTQPFGAFFSHLVTDPMSKDAYEVKRVGASVGYASNPLWGLNVSVTAYRGAAQVDHLFESGLFDSEVVTRASAKDPDTVGSFVLAAGLAPFRDLLLGAAYVTEPGAARRNQTVGVWAGYTWGRVTAESEVYVAVSRERYALAETGERFGKAFLEKVVTLGLAYRPMTALELAARYERFWDGGLADAAGTWSARNRFGVGGGYTFYEKDEIALRLSVEYRFSDFRRGGAARETAAADQHELFAKIAVTYK